MQNSLQWTNWGAQGLKAQLFNSTLSDSAMSKTTDEVRGVKRQKEIITSGWCNELNYTCNMQTQMHSANTTRKPGRLRLIHMQMWGGASARKREEMSLSESSTGERREREKGTAWGGHTAPLTAWGAALREAAVTWASMATDDRCQREREERQLPLRRTMRRR